MELFAHQKEIIARNPKYHGLWMECGTGKTAIAIRLTEKNCGGSALVVCPKSLKENWRREIERWATMEIDWKIISKEEHKRDWEKLAIEKRGGLIEDEAHYKFGYKSQMFKVSAKYIKAVKPKSVYLLTATPYLSSPYNVYCAETLLGRNPKWTDYRFKYFNMIRMGAMLIPQVKPNAKYALAKTLNEIGTTVKKEDCLDLPDQVYLREDFSLTKEQRRVLRDLETNPLVSNHIVLFTKRHQLAGGTIKLPEAEKGDSNIICKSDKLNRLLEISGENNKCIVVCRYNAEIELIASKLKKPYVVLNGSVPGDERQKRLDYANSQDEMVFLVNAACSEGWNATSFNTMVFYSNGFSYKDRVQIEGRIHRIGQINRCTYIDLVMKDDVDEDILAALKNKSDFSFEIYAGRDKSH